MVSVVLFSPFILVLSKPRWIPTITPIREIFASMK
jgi:hypothetical protein